MLNAVISVVHRAVLVEPVISVLHPTVDPNVLLTQIALVIWLVLERNAEIHVLGHAALELDVLFWTMYRFAHVLKDSLEIRLATAIPNHYVSLTNVFD